MQTIIIEIRGGNIVEIQPEENTKFIIIDHDNLEAGGGEEEDGAEKTTDQLLEEATDLYQGYKGDVEAHARVKLSRYSINPQS